MMRLVLITALLLSLLACSQSEPVHKRELYTFGTLVELTIYGGEKEQVDLLFDEIDGLFSKLHKAWHPWQGGELAELNSAFKRGESAPVSEELRGLLKASVGYFEQSGGLFNPAVGELVRLWGFHQEEASSRPPPQEWIDGIIKNKPQIGDLQFLSHAVASSNRGVTLDLGAVAKGYAVDQAITLLKSKGVQHAIVNAGGDLRAIGKHGDRNWRIGVKHPRERGVLASIEILGDESVFTSGDYERYFQFGGRRYHHILDPYSGMPAEGVTSVTVIHSSAEVADAASTALFIAGPKAMPQIARAMGIEMVMMLDDVGGLYLTPAMEKRIKLGEWQPDSIWVTNP